jgi:alpha-galactosidase
MWRYFSIAVLLLSAAAPGAPSAFAASDETGASDSMEGLRIGNDRVERILLWRGKEAIVGKELRMGAGRNTWAAPAVTSPEYRFTIRHPETGALREFASADPHERIEYERRAEGAAVVTVLRFIRSDGPVTVELTYESQPDHAFVRRYATLTNAGDQPIILEEWTLEELALDRPTDARGLYGLERTHKKPVWFTLHHQDLAEQESAEFETGRGRAATWLALERKNAAEGLIFGWETTEPTRCRIDRANGVRVTEHPAVPIAPGETFKGPASFVGLFEGDMDEGCYRAQRFVEEHVAWPIPDDNFPYLMFNSWGYGTAVYDSLAREAIKLCEKLDVEVFVTDFGWEGPDWDPLPEAFPHGLRPIAELCHNAGMKFGIHFSYANVSDLAQVYKEHPDWVYGRGAWAYGALMEDRKTFALSLALPEARQWITDKVVEVLDRQKVDWFLTDSTLWGHIDPEKHPVPGDQEYLGAKAHEAVLEEVHRRRPKILIEHCDGGLTLPSYAMMRQHVTSITCDNAQALDTRISVYDLSYFLPPRYLDKYQQEWRSHYANRSCMLGGPWILMTPINELEPGSRDWIELTEDIALYKQYRSLIRDGKVLHLLRPDDPKNADWDGWDAIGSYNPDRDAAIVFVFRTRGENRQRTVPMKGLRPDGNYEVRYLDTGRTYTASGAEIVRDGFALGLDAYKDDPHSQCSEVIVVDPR